MSEKSQLTLLLNRWRTGDEALMAEILPAVYDELHRVAHYKMRNQPANHTLQATALINEAFIRLGDVKSQISDRGHFVGIVANLMRQILVDHARSKGAQKRGGDAIVVDLADVQVAAETKSDDILAIEEVLSSMEERSPQKVRLAELYYFCGATYAEAADALGISESTAERELRLIKAMLTRRLSLGDDSR